MFNKKTLRVEYTYSYMAEYGMRGKGEGFMNFTYYIFRPSSNAVKRRLRRAINERDIQFKVLSFKPQP